MIRRVCLQTSPLLTFLESLTSAHSLLGPGQDSWRVDDADALQNLVGHLRTLESGALEESYKHFYHMFSVKKPLESIFSALHPSLCRPLCPFKARFAVGFLKENDRYCQNRTITPANDVWLRTTTRLPVV